MYDTIDQILEEDLQADIKRYLKENLSIRINGNHIELWLDDEKISEAFSHIRLNE